MATDEYSEESEIPEFNFNSVEEFEIMKKNYFVNNLTNNNYYVEGSLDFMPHTIKDSTLIVNHIIVCGVHPALIHFLLPLRSKYLGEDNIRYIVILAENLPQMFYENLSKIPKIIYIKGSPLLPENLYRANITNADKAVILSNEKNLYTEEQMMDAESIFIYKAIRKCNKKIQIMTELVCTPNIEYLLKQDYLDTIKKEDDSVYEFTPIFAAGEVFTPSIIDRLTCQAYYNPHIITILDLILNGGETNKNRKIREIEEKLKLKKSHLWLINVPEALYSDNFENLFNHLLSCNHVIALCLYRLNVAQNFYYIYTNPKKNTIILENDKVFVIGQPGHISDMKEKAQPNKSENDEEDDDGEEEEVDDAESLNLYTKNQFDGSEKNNEVGK